MGYFLTVAVENELIGSMIVVTVVMYPSLSSGMDVVTGLEGAGEVVVWDDSQVSGLCDVGYGRHRQAEGGGFHLGCGASRQRGRFSRRWGSGTSQGLRSGWRDYQHLGVVEAVDVVRITWRAEGEAGKVGDRSLGDIIL